MEPAPSGRDIPPWACFFITITIIAIAAVELRWQGRSWFSTTGAISVWSGDAWGRENSQQLFDPYTFTHVSHGIVIYALVWLIARKLPPGVRLLLGVALEASWEAYENTDAVIERYRAATMALGYYGDSIFNSVGDILACVVGYIAAAKLPVRATVWMAIGLELFLTLWIRDSLLLNIVMLTYPIEAVKTWQLQIAPP